MAGKRKRGKAKRKAQDVSSRAYEGAMSVPHRRHVVGANLSHDAAVERAYPRLREWGRYLDENHDLVGGILDELVLRTVGPGIVTIPKPMRPSGEVDVALGKVIAKRWSKWMRECDVTGRLHWYRAQRLLCRAWKRDGDAFVQHVTDRYPFPSGTTPYRIEILESDMVPHDLHDQGGGWRQGVQLDSWRRPRAYAVYKQHPGDVMQGGLTVTLADVLQVPAVRITHLANADRWPATRGVSALHRVVSRLYDIKDLEESERIKNRVLASWTAAIKKSPDVPGWNPHDSTSGDRFIQMSGGTVIDTLAPGEEITGVGPEYPNPELNDYIADQIRRVATGTNTRYSSISKNYDGSYSAQRQESVEAEGHDDIRTDDFVSGCARVVYERWLTAEVISGQTSLSPGMTLDDAMNAEYRGPVTPWIDPLKEVQADALMVEKGFQSQEQIQIKRGASPDIIGSQPQTTPGAARPGLTVVDDDEKEEDAA